MQTVLKACVKWKLCGHPVKLPVDAGRTRGQQQPDRAQPEALREDVTIIVVRRDGQPYEHSSHIEFSDLHDIRRGKRRSVYNKIYLAVDARPQYGETRRIVNERQWSS